jgi:hypothetical protein
MSHPSNPSHHLFIEMNNSKNLNFSKLVRVSATEIEEESIRQVPIPEFLSRDQKVDRFLLSLESFPERAGLGLCCAGDGWLAGMKRMTKMGEL